MKIAIPYENGQVFQHFGHSAQFKLYTAEEGRITGAEDDDVRRFAHIYAFNCSTIYAVSK